VLKLLSDRPNGEKLQRYCRTLLEQRRADLECIVLFGSMARGNWSRGSDYDLLIGLHGDDGQRLLDRMLAFVPSEALDVEVFPYSRSEWQRMFRACHPLFLEALEHGIGLWDRGAFAEMRTMFVQ